MRTIPTILIYISFTFLFNQCCFAQSVQQLIVNPEKADQIENNTGNFYTGNVETRQPFLKNSENSEVLYQETFNKYENKKLSDILNDSPSINASYGEKGETTLYVRGFHQRQVPVLLDGIPVYVPFDGLLGLDRINGSNVQNIKVVKTAPSIIYGPNTMGGVISIKTQKPTEPFKLKINFNDNQVNTLNQDLYIGSKIDDFYFSYNQSYSKSHGFNLSQSFNPALNENGGTRDNSDYHSLNFNGSIGYSSNDNQDYRLSYNFLSSPWNVPPEIEVSTPRYWQFTKWKKNTAIFSLKQPVLQDRIIFNSAVFYDKYFNILDAYDNGNYSSQDMNYAFHSVYDDYSTGFNFTPEIIVNKHVKITPVCLYKRDIHREIPDIGSLKEKYSISTTTLGTEIELNPTDKLNITLGSSLNNYNPLYNNGDYIRDSLIAWDSQGGISYFINDTNKVFLDIGRKTRFPTLKELYSGYIGRNIPNPNLNEETALRYEVGYVTEFKDITQLNISLFRSNIDNLITNMPIETNLYQNQNINKALIQGVDTNLKIQLVKNKLNLNFGYVFTDAANKSAERTSKNLAYIPQNKIFAGFTFNFPFSITSDLSLVYVGRVNYQDNTDLEWKKLRGYPLLSFGLLKKFKDNYVAYINIKNVLDRNYETFHNFPMPGISVNMGIKLEI